MRERDYLIALKHIPGFGPKTIKTLLEQFHSAEYLWSVSGKELKQQSQLSEALIDSLLAYRSKLDPEEIREGLAKKGIQTTTMLDDDYPESLRQLPDPPPVLFYRGQWHKPSERCFGIVGSRKATVYGQKVAHQFGKELAQAGFVIVSGMARGIDSCAHRGCLEAGGRTIAVLGSGLDVIYPRENKKLAEQIAETGVLLTECVPGTAPLPQNFPARNRIIAGLSLGILVVEAAAKSGALITADFALEQGKDVFAVPGPITSPNSKGTNLLIKQGAKLVDQVGDILEEYAEYAAGVEPGPPEVQAALLLLTPDEQAVYELLDWTPQRVEELVDKTGWTAGKLQTVLTMLELHGLVEQLPGRQFIRKSL